MSLQFIFGNSGSGKSHWLYQSIIEDSIKHPEKNYLVLVPEQFTMQTQKDLCLMHPRGGIMNIDVLSFGRLAHRVFEEVGRDSLPVLDDEGKNLVLRKIAGNFEDELTVLKGNLKKQGYISEVKSVISEFTQYGVDLDRIDGFMEGLDQDSYLYYKLKDIRRLYEGFEDYLSEKYITKEEMLDVLSDVVPQSEILKDSVVAMDGFTGFTPVQDRLLGELLRVCGRVMITVEMDGREDPFVYRHPYQLQRWRSRCACTGNRRTGSAKIRRWHSWSQSCSAIQERSSVQMRAEKKARSGRSLCTKRGIRGGRPSMPLRRSVIW